MLAIVVEVQLASDADKRWTWPVYVSALRARLRCACMLFIVTAEEATARWAAEPIALGPPGFVLTPLVPGPGAVPVVTDPVVAAEAPELAVLSAMAHGRDDATEQAARVAHAAFRAVDRLDEERARLYADLHSQPPGRGRPVPAEVRDRILACRDLAELERWVVRAATVGTVDELFAGGPS